MPERAMPDRRDTVRQKMTINGVRVYLDVGLYEDGAPGELFIAVEKTGSEMRLLYDEFARLSSKLLQYGCSVEALMDGRLGIKSESGGPVQGHPQIKNCTSILDGVARHLLIEYCGREDLAHVKKEQLVEQREEL